MRKCGWRCQEDALLLVLSILLSISFLSPILVLCAVECLTLCNAKVMKSSIVWHLSLLLFHFSLPSNLVPNAPLVAPTPHGSFFLSYAFVVCHLVVLLRLIACFKVLMTAFGFGSQTHPMALHALSAITSDRNGSFIFVQIVLAVLAILVVFCTSRPLSFFFNRNKRLIVFVSLPLILSKTAWLKDQLSLPKQNTL